MPLNSASKVSRVQAAMNILDLPLSPFMTTQIFDPTHLSMSSASNVSISHRDNKKATYREEEVVTPYLRDIFFVIFDDF